MKIEKNKLIAKFMNLEPYEDSRYGTLWFSPIKDEKGANFVLKFDTSWGWLMTVVEKIESINDTHHGYFGVYISSNSCTIQGTKFRSDKIAEPPVYFSTVTLNTKFDATYYCVVKFIEWYNEYINE